MLSMSENKTNLGDILGGMMGATAPMMTGLIRSMFSPGIIKSVVGMISDLLGAVVEVISSIDLGEILSSTLGAILPVAVKLLDSLLDLVSPLLERITDLLSPFIRLLDPLLEALIPLIESVGRRIKSLTGEASSLSPFEDPFRKGGDNKR